MAVPNLAEIMRIPGTVIKAPSDLSAAYPYGGTVLGAISEVEAQEAFADVTVRDENFGIVTEVLYSGSQLAIGFNLRGYDADAIGTVFPDTTLGTSGKRIIGSDPTTYRAGSKGTARAVALLYAPDNPLNHPAVYFPAAIPRRRETSEIALDLRIEAVWPVLFLAVQPSGGGDPYQIGLIEELTL